MMAVTISRSKVYRSRFATGGGSAWKWLYDVLDSAGNPLVQGTDRLSIARRIAKQANKGNHEPISETWKERKP